MYKDFLRKCGRSPKVINDFLDDSYCRLYAGDDRLPITKVNSRCRIYLYDTNIIHGDWQSILSSINKRTTSGIYCIHPVTCTGLGQFFTLRRYQKFSRSNKIILDIDVPQEDIRLLFSKYTNKFLADITLASKVYLPIGGAFSSPSGYYKNFIYAVDLLFCFGRVAFR